MEMFVVRGGTPLAGTVRVSGAKNAALPILASTLAITGKTTLQNLPDLVDVRTLIHLLQSLGMTTQKFTPGMWELTVSDESQAVAEYDLVRKMRASVCVLGPLLARRKRACVSLPGGCNIGDRPIDLHLKGLAALGADIRVERGYVIAETQGLRGADIFLGGPFGSTVTGTCNVMVAAALAKGRTTIEAAACEPEVADLGKFLNAAGARISGLGTPFLEIEGVEELQGVDHHVIPDRIEAATLMIAAAMTGGNITLEHVELSHLTSVIEKLREIGVSIEKTGPQFASVSMRNRPKPVDCVTQPYPGIPTDLQAQLMALLTQADGISVVTEKVFPDRFLHAPELVRLGAKVRRESATAIVTGVDRLSGACVMASDLRASAALVIAALAAEGDTVIRRIYHLDRGYERLEEKLNRLGADIRRVTDEPQHLPEALQPESLTPHTLRGPHSRTDHSAMEIKSGRLE